MLDKRALRLRRPALRPCETMMKNDCVTGRVLSLHRILKQTVPRVLSSIDHGLFCAPKCRESDTWTCRPTNTTRIRLGVIGSFDVPSSVPQWAVQ